ncbi:MAG: methyltransferase domain-containing protein [Syntrophorhabdales bacterium]|jgi:SAM-dependent methyltransferase
MADMGRKGRTADMGHDDRREPIAWSRLFDARKTIHGQYRRVGDIPLIKSGSRLLKGMLKDGDSLLDVGAGDRGLKDRIARMGIHIDYRSMDVDRSARHDFYDLAAIEGQYDVVVLFEVIEHLGLEEGLSLLTGLARRLKEDGRIVVSTPNIFTPGRFMRDSSHKTFYSFEELCGLLAMAGFEIAGVYRSYNDAFHRYVLKVYLLGFLFRFLSIDYAYSIFAVGKMGSRPPDSSAPSATPL